MNGTILEVPSKKMKTKMNGDQLLNASPKVKPSKPFPASSTWNSSIFFIGNLNAQRIITNIDTMAPIISAKSGPMNVAVKYSGIMKAKSAIIVNGIKPFNAFVP